MVLTLVHSERPKLYAILAFLSAIRLNLPEFFSFVGIYDFTLWVQCALLIKMSHNFMALSKFVILII